MHDVRQKVRLNCSADDVLFAYRDDPTAHSLARAQREQEESAKRKAQRAADGDDEGEVADDEVIGSKRAHTDDADL